MKRSDVYKARVPLNDDLLLRAVKIRLNTAIFTLSEHENSYILSTDYLL